MTVKVVTFLPIGMLRQRRPIQDNMSLQDLSRRRGWLVVEVSIPPRRTRMVAAPERNERNENTYKDVSNLMASDTHEASHRKRCSQERKQRASIRRKRPPTLRRAVLWSPRLSFLALHLTSILCRFITTRGGGVGSTYYVLRSSCCLDAVRTF